MVTNGNFRVDHTRLLTDEAATKEGIIGALGDQWLGKSAGPNDLIVLYISSHGSQSMQEAGGTNFLVAYDTDKDRLLSTGIPMQWLVQLIGEQVHCKRLLLLLDVCHSGSVAEGQKGLFRQNLDPKNLVIGQGQIVVCSSSSDQVSWESKEYPNSVFTKRLIEALNNKGGDSTLSEACLIMSDRVEEEVLRDRNAIQTPIVKRSWEGGGDLVLLDSSAQPFTSGATAREGDQ
jgi:uncharacterized caspase-like protein